MSAHSQRLPLFNLFEYPMHPQLYAALKAVGPSAAWRLMSELAAVDIPLYEAQNGGARHQHLIERAGAAMARVPGLAHRDRARDALSFAAYGPRLQFESTYLVLWLDDRRLMGEVLEVDGMENLEAAASMGRGILALPLHVGPSYPIAPIMSHHGAVTAVFNRMNFDDMKELAFPDLPIEALQLDSSSVASRAIADLREGRIFSIFPELDPRGVDRHHQVVPFLGTHVHAPSGPIVLARLAKAPLLPVSITGLGRGRFRLSYHEPLDPPASAAGTRDVLLRLWSLIENVVLNGEVGEWEMWFDFESMMADGQAEDVTSRRSVRVTSR